MVYGAVIFIMLLIVSLAIYRSVISNLDEQVNNNLRERAEAVRAYFTVNTEFTQRDLEAFGRFFGGTSITNPLNNPSNTSPAAPTPKVNFKANNSDLAASLIYLQVTFSKGPVWSVPDVEVMTLPQTQNDLRSVLATAPKFSDLRLKGGERVRVFTEPLVVRGQMAGHIQAVRSLEEVDAIISSLTAPFLISALAALMLMVLAGWLVTRRAFAPIERITEAAYRIGVNNNLAERIETDTNSNDEVSRLGRAFNAMLDRVEKNFKAQKQFVADSSHELRTPLTVIRGNVDLIKRNPDPRNQTESLQAIEREAARMQRLVEDLLLLAQADARQSVEMQPIQLDTLVLETYMNTRVLADSKRQILKLGHFEPVIVMGDADRLKRALLNLVDNAIKYTPEEGTVSIELRKGTKWVRVVVADSGIGIAEKDQPLIFDRFYRVDKARSRKSGSTGLGLSIVKYIVEAHGGRISLESEAGKGSTFTIWLPRDLSDTDTNFSDEDDFAVDTNPTPLEEPVANPLPADSTTK